MAKIDTQFAKQLAHDLKAPLSALTILKDCLPEEEQKELLQGSIERYQKIIGQILEASKGR